VTLDQVLDVKLIVGRWILLRQWARWWVHWWVSVGVSRKHGLAQCSLSGKMNDLGVSKSPSQPKLTIFACPKTVSFDPTCRLWTRRTKKQKSTDMAFLKMMCFNQTIGNLKNLTVGILLVFQLTFGVNFQKRKLMDFLILVG
jgi:hypothetical protein